jgi:hypothetical protein
VHCSSCELLLDRYVEGTLPATMMVAIDDHVRECTFCAQLLTELRVVDALLATTKPVELAPNFTFAVMADARTTQVVRAHPSLVWAWLSFYLIAAWVAVSAAYAVFGHRLPSIVAQFSAARGAVSQFVMTTGAAAHAVSPLIPVAVATVVVALAIDALLACAIILYHRAVRPRLAERLAPLRQAQGNQ